MEICSKAVDKEGSIFGSLRGAFEEGKESIAKERLDVGWWVVMVFWSLGRR